MDADQSDESPQLDRCNSLESHRNSSQSSAPWYDRWRNLESRTLRDRPAFGPSGDRDSQLLPADAGFHSIAWQVDRLASKSAETALRELDDRLEAH